MDLSRAIAMPEIHNLKLPEVVIHEVERLQTVEDKYTEEINRINILENQIKDYKSRLRSMYLPKYIALGFQSFIYLAIVGIAVPLAFLLWTDLIGLYLNEVGIFALFLTGVIGNLGYLCLEIRQALRQT